MFGGHKSPSNSDLKRITRFMEDVGIIHNETSPETPKELKLYTGLGIYKDSRHRQSKEFSGKEDEDCQ